MTVDFINSTRCSCTDLRESVHQYQSDAGALNPDKLGERDDRFSFSVRRASCPVHIRHCGCFHRLATQAWAKASVKDVVKTYADIAHAGYEDSLLTAQKLQDVIEAFLKKPDDKTLQAARDAWLAARVPYQQTEVFRFGNSVVDDWEGKVNAWPLDEGLIDYVADIYGTESDENELYAANIIANKSLKIGGQQIEVPKITKSLLTNVLHEAGEIEANVATGYHAVEFMLWGQDLNGTDKGAGNRPRRTMIPRTAPTETASGVRSICAWSRTS